MKRTIILSVFLAIVFISCNENKDTRMKSCCSKEKPAAKLKALSGESVYNLTSPWVTQNNQSIQLTRFEGKIIIVAMIFTHCESACPRIVADMQRIESALSTKELRQIDFLLISMNPERDTPARLTEFSKEHNLKTNWTLICSNKDATMEIANVLGVRVKKLEGGGFDHSNVIHVFNQEGLIVHQQNGFAVEQGETLEAIRNLLKIIANN